MIAFNDSIRSRYQFRVWDHFTQLMFRQFRDEITLLTKRKAPLTKILKETFG